MKIIKIISSKNNFNITRVKAVANEHYMIVDESEKPFNKLKFVQIDKNLEVYAEIETKEEKIAILENYYDPNMNTSIVGMDSSDHEIGYLLNSEDGWYYLGGELPETELGVIFPFFGPGVVAATGAGGIIATGDNNDTNTTDPSADAINKIRDAAQNNNADSTLTLDIYSSAGIIGVTNENIVSINSSLNTLIIDGLKADTKIEVQTIVDSYNNILAEANGEISDITPNNDPTANDYVNIGANIPSVVNNAESLKLLNDIIKTKEKVDVDTVPEIEDLGKSVKNIIDVASGNKDNISANTIINDLNKFGITANGSSINNLNPTQQQKILDVIKATNDNGSEVNTKQKIQDIVNNALKDITAPDAPIITSDEYTIDITPVITGISESGSKITVVLGEAMFITTAASDGTWSVDTKNLIPVSGVLDTISETGTKIVVTATDLSNNVSIPTTQLLKSIPPAIISGYEDNSGIIQNENSVELITDDTTPGISIGILSTSAKEIGLNINGQHATAEYDPIKGTLTPKIPLKDGIYTFSYEYILSSTKVTSNSFTLTIDTKAPIISIDDISNDNMINLTEKLSGVVISGTTDAEDGQSVIIEWGSSTKTALVNNGVWDINFTNNEIPADGITTIKASVTDKAGNPSLQFSKTVLIDTKEPTQTILNLHVTDNVGAFQGELNSGDYTDDITSGLDSSLFNIDSVTGVVSFKTIPSYSFPSDSGADNIYSFIVAATDLAGNTTEKAVDVTVTLANSFDLGTVSGIHLNLINKAVMQDGKVYYFLDTNGDGISSTADYINHDKLDTLFNNGANTSGTSTPSAGQDTERSVIVNGYTLIFPNASELLALYNDPLPNPPSGWILMNYWTSTASGPIDNHAYRNFNNGNIVSSADTTNLAVALQVLPVTIDLDGDGTISYTQKIMDVNSDGKFDVTSWVDKNDGVLIWDKYHDGKLHDSSQYELSQYGGKTDLEGLAVGFDTNHDGIFDLSDEKFAEFRIWQDLNNDGISQDGEIKTLADWGIININLTSDKITRIDNVGVIEDGRSLATKIDGSKVAIGDVGFNYVTIDDTLNSLFKTYFESNEEVSKTSNDNLIGLVSNYTKIDDTKGEMVDVWFATQPSEVKPVVVYNAPVVIEEEKIQTVTF